MAFECTSDTGFSLVETLVATLLAVVVSAGVVELFLNSTSAIRDAREEMTATTLAVQKLEELRGTPALAWSPDDALEQTTAGFADIVDAFGAPVAAAVAPRTTVYVRRWSVRPLPSDPIRGYVLRVFVSSARRVAARVHIAGPIRRAHADVLLATVRTTR